MVEGLLLPEVREVCPLIPKDGDVIEGVCEVFPEIAEVVVVEDVV